MLRVPVQMVRIVPLIPLENKRYSKSRRYQMSFKPDCVPGSRFPMNNFVFTTLPGPLIVNVRICICEEKERDDQ